MTLHELRAEIERRWPGRTLCVNAAAWNSHGDYRTDYIVNIFSADHKRVEFHHEANTIPVLLEMVWRDGEASDVDLVLCEEG